MIIRVADRRRFTVVDNRPIEDPALSFRALGMLAYLLSKPDGWEVSYRHLSTVKAEGQHAVRMALAELEQLRYLVRRKEQGGDGRWIWTSYVYEVPLADVELLEPFPTEEALAGPCGDSRGTDSRGPEERGEATTDQEPLVTPSDFAAPPSEAKVHREPGVPSPAVARAIADAARALGRPAAG